MTMLLSIHSAIDGHLDSVQLGAIMNIASRNILVLVLCRISFLLDRWIPRGEVANIQLA